MNTPTRQFEDKPAVRESVPLLVGIQGPSGGGKTFSALRLATGIQRVTGGDVFMVDTEARRGLHYAENFKFRHLDFKAPFSPMDYLAAIEHCYAKGGRTIIVDSMSHEHEGPGGVLEMHASELERMGGDQKKTFLAWQKPKMERRRMLNTILQIPANFIFCFRAKEKLKVIPGKQPENLGYMAIAGEELIFEMTASCLLLPAANGVPSWQTDYAGEKMMTKLPVQFKTLLSTNQPLSEDMGQTMAEWAKGSVVAPKPAVELPAAWNDWSNEERGEWMARKGIVRFREWWKTLEKAAQEKLTSKTAEWKTIAESAPNQ